MPVIVTENDLHAGVGVQYQRVETGKERARDGMIKKLDSGTNTSAQTAEWARMVSFVKGSCRGATSGYHCVLRMLIATAEKTAKKW